jgi:hypothetical protein
MTQLVRTADPTRTESDAKLTVVTLMGQMMVFRVGRAGVMRHLGWKRLGPGELAAVQDLVRRNLQRLLVPVPPTRRITTRGGRRPAGDGTRQGTQ